MPPQAATLVLQPDLTLQTLMVRVLKTASLIVFKAATARAALEIYERESIDLLILDHNLPDRDALDLCAAIRQSSAVPLLMVGATSDAYTRSMAIDQGIDDYLVTPFHEVEFLARVRALLRRSSGQLAGDRDAQAAVAIQCGSLEINCIERRVLNSGQPIHLTKTEWALLSVFLQHPGQILTHRMLLQQVWGKTYSDDRNYLHAYIRRLRCKLEDDPAQPQLIRSESGIGYRFLRLEERARASQPKARQSATQHLLAVNHQLPLTSLIGRDHEVAALSALLLKPDVRLVTLTGVGGSGKTCLAGHLAARLRSEFVDGVIFVALDSLTDPQRLPATLARAAGIHDRGDDQPLERIASLISDQRMLIILDNFEQVLAAAPCVNQVLQACPNLKILITSRILLGIYGEHQFALPPMGLPDLQHLPTLEQIAAIPAIELFVRRAQAVEPTFGINSDNAPIIAEICVRLDGLPLAMELAAVHSKFYSPQDILQRLGKRLDFLQHSGLDRSARQNSLRGAIEWSYDLLSEYERVIFLGIAVFEGCFTCEAALALWPDDDPAVVERALQGLVNASMLQRESGHDELAWFGMLHTIRQYALLRQPAEQLYPPLLEYYVRLVKQAESAFLVSNHSSWLARLEREHPTILAVLGWLCGDTTPRGRPVPLAAWELCAAIWRFWYEHGHINEGRAWLARLQSAPTDGIGLMTRDQVALGVGVLAFIQDDYVAAQAAFEQILTPPRGDHDPSLVAQALSNLGLLAYWQCRYSEAIEVLAESLRLFQSLDDRYGIAGALRYLGMARLNQGDQRAALALLADSLTWFQSLGSQSGIGSAMSFYGRALLSCEDYQEAAHWLEQSMTTLAALGNRPGLARSQTYLGRVALAQDDHVRAYELLRNSLGLFHQVGDREGIATALEGLALVEACQGCHNRATAFYRGAVRLRAMIGAPLPPADRKVIQRLLSPWTIQALQRSTELPAIVPSPLNDLIVWALSSADIVGPPISRRSPQA